MTNTIISSLILIIFGSVCVIMCSYCGAYIKGIREKYKENKRKRNKILKVYLAVVFSGITALFVIVLGILRFLGKY